MSIKDYTYLAAILIIIGALIAWRESGVREGEAKVHAAEQRAAQKQQLEDKANAQKTVDSLNAELNQLRADSLKPSVGVRCSTYRVPAPVITPRAPPVPTPATGIPEVPDGSGDGTDLGPSLQRLALAADVVSARDRACLAWAKGLQ